MTVYVCGPFLPIVLVDPVSAENRVV